MDDAPTREEWRYIAAHYGMLSVDEWQNAEGQ